MNNRTFETVLVIDDHQLFANGVIAALKKYRECLQVEAANSMETANEQLKERTFDLILLDLRLPGLSGMSAFRAVRTANPDAAVVVLSAYVSANMVRQLIDEGANGVMEKDLSADVLVSAINLIESGAVYVPPSLMSRAESVMDTDENESQLDSGISRSAREKLANAGIREREISVADAMCRGLSNKEIARELGLQEGTVKVYISTILRILKVNNRVRATLVLHA